MELGKEAGRPKPAQPEPCRHDSGETSEVVAFEAKADGKELGRATVPGTLLRNSLAAAGGRVFVVTEEGSVCCLNGD
jgi:outer membrane protein assembly factor BamB